MNTLDLDRLSHYDLSAIADVGLRFHNGRATSHDVLKTLLGIAQNQGPTAVPQFVKGQRVHPTPRARELFPWIRAGTVVTTPRRWGFVRVRMDERVTVQEYAAEFWVVAVDWEEAPWARPPLDENPRR